MTPIPDELPHTVLMYCNGHLAKQKVTIDEMLRGIPLNALSECILIEDSIDDSILQIEFYLHVHRWYVIKSTQRASSDHIRNLFNCSFNLTQNSQFDSGEGEEEIASRDLERLLQSRSFRISSINSNFEVSKSSAWFLRYAQLIREI